MTGFMLYITVFGLDFPDMDIFDVCVSLIKSHNYLQTDLHANMNSLLIILYLSKMSALTKWSQQHTEGAVPNSSVDGVHVLTKSWNTLQYNLHVSIRTFIYEKYVVLNLNFGISALLFHLFVTKWPLREEHRCTYRFSFYVYILPL
jgi:hypothetical protein